MQALLTSASRALPLQLALTFAVSPKHTRPASDVARRDYAPDIEQPSLSVPDVSDALLWRLARFYRDIFALSLNERGGCYARSRYFVKTYGRGSAPTLRRWLGILEASGWLRRLPNGPHRLIVPLVSPREIVAALPRFGRLFKRVASRILSGYGVPAPLSLDREINSNSAAPRPPAVPKPALSAEERAVVVASTAAGVAADAAERLVRETGVHVVKDTLDALAYYRQRYARSGKEIENPGGWIREFAEHLAKGLWSLPAKLIETREREERKADRDRVARKRQVVAGPEMPKHPAPPSDAARLMLLPEADVAELERRGREAL